MNGNDNSGVETGMSTTRKPIEEYDKLYEIALNVEVDPDTVDEAYDELTVGNEVEMRDGDYGLLRVIQRIVAPGSDEAYRRAANSVSAQLECAGLSEEMSDLVGRRVITQDGN